MTKNPSHSTPPQSVADRFQLRCLSGKENGVVRTFDSDPMEVSKRFQISQKGPWLVAKSMTDQDFMINGEFCSEVILELGDTLTTEAGEYRLEGLKVANPRRERLVKSLSFAAFAVIVIGIFFPYAFPEASPWPPPIPVETVNNAYNQAVGFVTAPPKTKVVIIPQDEYIVLPSPAAKPNLPAKSIPLDGVQGQNVLSGARIRLGVAQQFIDDSPIDIGNIYWAIMELEGVEQLLNTLNPAPDMLATVITKRANLEKQHNEDLRNIYIRIQMAAQLGDQAESVKLARRMMAMSPNAESNAFRAARQFVPASSN